MNDIYRAQSCGSAPSATTRNGADVATASAAEVAAASPTTRDGAGAAAPPEAVVAAASITTAPPPGAAAIGGTSDLPSSADADAQMSAAKARFYDLFSEREEKSKGGEGAKYLNEEEYNYAVGVVTNWQPEVKHEAKDYRIKKKFFIGQGVAGNSLCLQGCVTRWTSQRLHSTRSP